MKYSNGFLRSFIGNKWFVETKENHLIYKSYIECLEKLTMPVLKEFL